MAVHQKKDQADLEKRLKILRRQFYGIGSEGKTSPKKVTISLPKDKLYSTDKINSSEKTVMVATTDLNYLGKDLLKIITLATVALGIQLALYFGLKNQLINLPFIS